MGTSHTVTGLMNGTKYHIRVTPCNRESACLHWSERMGFSHASVSGRPQAPTTPPPPPPITTPGPVRDLTLTPGDHELGVRWRAPSRTGGRTISRYPVRYKGEPAAVTVWTSNPEVTISDPAVTSVTTTVPILTGDDRLPLTNGAPYLVQVRACNGPTDLTDCGNWTQQSGTPEAPRPRDLNVVPRAGRRAILTWEEVPGAARYQVQARVLGLNDENGWHAVECKGVIGDGPIQRRCEIELEHITTVDGAKLGLQNHEAYALQVRVLRPQEGAFSATVILIDTPITKANGANSQAEITWQPVDKAVTNLGANFTGGSYQLRYRKAEANAHRKSGWTPSKFEAAVATHSTTEQILNAGQVSELRVDVIDAISTATAGPLYAVQLVYKDDPNNSQDADVFAARNVYVWPSSSEPAAYSVVGGLFLERRLGGKNVAYRICGDSFGPSGDSRREAWEALIESAFGQWTTATHGLVIFLPPVDGCATDDVSKDTYVTIKENLKDILGNNLTPTLDSQIELQVRSYVNGLRRDGITSRLIEDSHKYSEVYMFDDMSLGPLIRAYVFRDIAGDIGYGIACWFNPSGAWAETRMCTGSIYDDESNVESTDIIVRRGAYDAGLWSSLETGELSDDLRLPVTDARFGTCFNDGSDDWKSAYTDMVHEVGHLIGIAGHPGFSDTVMNYDNLLSDKRRQKEPDCTPHPIDIMAVYALYQTGF